MIQEGNRLILLDNFRTRGYQENDTIILASEHGVVCDREKE